MSDDKVYGDMESATNADPDKTTSTEENPPDTASGGTPEPAEGDDE